MIVFPCQVDLVMARAAAEIRLFICLVRVEMAATVGRHTVYPASMFLVQKKTGAVLASGGRQSPDTANLAAINHDRSRARQQVIERKFDRVAVSEVQGDPPYIGREQKAGNELAIDFTSFAIAHRALKTELSPSIRHGGFTSC